MAEIEEKAIDNVVEASDEDSESENEDPKPTPMKYKEMFHPDNTAHFLETQANWWKFCFPLGIYYCL
jgi:hypothetical protein